MVSEDVTTLRVSEDAACEAAARPHLAQARKALMRCAEVISCGKLEDPLALYAPEALLAPTMEDEIARRLQEMPGIGPTTASVLAATLPDVSAFRSARDLSAWLGLTPKPHSSGGKARLEAISRMGNQYIRWLVYLGAMGVISTRKRTDPGEDCWDS